MEIKEKAKSYAEGKALDSITAAIEHAYEDGYKDGYKDGVSNLEPLILQGNHEDIEYVDLGLPSGTKWPSDYLRDKNGKILYFNFEEASRYNLPTKEQFQELLGNSVHKTYTTSNGKKCKILGINSKFINIEFAGVKSTVGLSKAPLLCFWLKNEIKNSNERYCAIFSGGLTESTLFMGYKAPILVMLDEK